MRLRALLIAAALFLAAIFPGAGAPPPQAVMGRSLPVINWNNPLTWHLGFLWVTTSGMQWDLVNNVTGSYSSPLAPIPSPYGQVTPFVYNGSNIQIPNFPGIRTDNDQGTGNFTIFVLANPPAGTTATADELVDFGGFGTTATVFTNTGLNLTVASGDIQIYVNCNGPATGVYASGAVDGNWHLYVFIIKIAAWGGTGWAIYEDGVSLSLNSFTSGASCTTIKSKQAGIGGDHAGGGSAGGNIAIAGMFNRVLTSAEIQSLTGNPFQLVSWPADQQ